MMLKKLCPTMSHSKNWKIILISSNRQKLTVGSVQYVGMLR